MAVIVFTDFDKATMATTRRGIFEQITIAALCVGVLPPWQGHVVDKCVLGTETRDQ